MITIAVAVLLLPLVSRLTDILWMRVVYGRAQAIPMIEPLSAEERAEHEKNAKEQQELVMAALRRMAGKEDWKP